VSGKVVDRAMMAKGKAMTIAANARNVFIVSGVLKAAQRANAAVIIEIAKSEGGAGAYCAVSSWNLATFVDACANELGVTVPVAVHADHYGIKGTPTSRRRGSRSLDVRRRHDSIAIDASHMPDDRTCWRASS
jgi:fructose-bisphosphate aldolase class II